MRLNGEHLRKTIHNTLLIIENEREYINRINVYPVADGDTGTNLYLTIKGIWQEIEDVTYTSASDMCRIIAESSLIHAKGNSGVILSQFLLGFKEGVNGKESLDTHDLAIAFAKGSEYAYRAVANPVEGTMLTVMRAVANKVKKLSRTVFSVVELLSSALNEGINTLKKTPEFLARLGKPRVIDSGAYGFVLFLEGFARAVGGNTKDFRYRSKRSYQQATNHPLYCCNYLVSGVLPEVAKNLLISYESLVIIGDEKMLKIHVHAKDPEKVENIIMKVGRVIDKKVERIW